MIKNFIKMPFTLKILFLATLFAPVIALFSVLTGTVLPEKAELGEYGAAKTLLELSSVFILVFPMTFLAILIYLKISYVKYLFPLGWTIVCLSPYTLSLVRQNSDFYSVGLLSNLFIGILITGYLVFSKQIKRYFSERKKEVGDN